MARVTRAVATLALILMLAFSVTTAGSGVALAGSAASTISAPARQGDRNNQQDEGFNDWGLLGLLGLAGLAGLRRRSDDRRVDDRR
ncbi:MAG: WGxxGxxG family protein [Chloroflexia bacterium]